ncbi:MAG: ABC transporter ATP-binding protein/permease [Roseburia sp.]|nr:ABC transporter ATP-binding protein/permease [Roseburia sp.]
MKKYMKRIKGYIFAEILLDILCTVFAAFIPVLQKEMFDSVSAGRLSPIPRIIGAFILLQGLSCLCTYFCMLYTWKGAIKFEACLKKEFIRALLHKDEQHFYAHSVGDYISLQGNDITALEQDYLQPWVDVFRSVNMFVIYAVVIVVFVDWRIALAIILSSFLVIVGPKITGKMMSERRLEYQNRMAGYVNRITDLLSGYKLVNNRTRGNLLGVHEAALNTTADRRYRYGKSKTLALSINDAAIKVIEIVSFVCVCVLLAGGEISIGAGVAAFGYVSSFISPLNSILEDVSAIQSTAEVRRKFLDIIGTGLRGERSAPQSVETGLLLRDVAFQNGEFSLKISELAFEKGKKYAVIGANGSGKSTLLKLIMQYLKPASGEILLDGHPIGTLDTVDCITYIDQNEYIYQAGLEENVTVFGSYPNVGRVFWDTFWNRGREQETDCRNMSGGEKQIIAFLRVIARDTPIILLDEPFAAMDAANTEKIQEYLLHGREMADKTVIIITHDTSEETLAKYDRVIRMETLQTRSARPERQTENSK